MAKGLSKPLQQQHFMAAILFTVFYFYPGKR
jgi:hypothetical protein